MAWYTDGEYKCNDCINTFKVYCKEDGNEVNFCPICASRDIEPIDEEE